MPAKRIKLDKKVKPKAKPVLTKVKAKVAPKNPKVPKAKVVTSKAAAKKPPKGAISKVKKERTPKKEMVVNTKAITTKKAVKPRTAGRRPETGLMGSIYSMSEKFYNENSALINTGLQVGEGLFAFAKSLQNAGLV
jgi:hypothetical protein